MPKPDVALNPLVMIRTFSAKLRVLGRSSIGRRSLASERGDTLIEVLISAVLIAGIVVATLTGLDSTNKATSLQRARSQADALAQQDEDRLRSIPITELKKLEETAFTQTIEEGGTKYKVTSSAKYIVDNAATTNCATTAPSAEYIQTISSVTWNSIGTGKPVVETGIVSPPPDTSLIVQVTGPSDVAEPGVEANITGPSTASALTSTNGCAILAVSPGEYEINVHQTGYVDQNWITESKNDSFYPSKVYLPAVTTTKEPYIFAKGARVNPLSFKYLNPTTGKEEPTKALNARMENTEMTPTFRLLRPESSTTPVETITQSEKIVYPFTAPYTVYAGSCLANKPPEKERVSITFAPGGEATPKLLLPSLIVDVWQNSKKEWEKEAAPKKLITSKPEIFLYDTDEGCESKRQTPETIEKQTEKGGALKYPGQPWGTYTVCVNVPYKNTKTGKTENKYFEEKEQKNNNPKQAGTVVNLYEGGTKGEKLLPEAEGSEKSCP
jgi:Tfp pilus assembly protein PilV